MKNGYYLSTYMHIDPLAHTSENYYRHDHNFSLWKISGTSAQLIHYWELERITRIKQHKYACYSKEQAIELIQKCLNKYNILFDDIIGIWGTPEISTIDLMNLHSKSKFVDFPLHSIAHAFSGFPIQNDQKVLCLAIDQGPDNIVKSSYDYKYHYLGIKYENGTVSDPIPLMSPALIWFETSELVGLKEGTLMALANATTCEFLNSQYALKMLSQLDLYSSRNLIKLKETIKLLYDLIVNNINNQNDLFKNIDTRFSKTDNALSALMKIIQEFSIKCMEANISKLISELNINPAEYDLSITGGYALNCPTNTYLMEKFHFRNFITPPCVSDTGISLGMAQYYFYLSGITTCGLTGAYWGDNSNISDNKILNEFQNNISKITEYDINQAVLDIINYPIVWFQGRSEVGPRALGNRSLIADPRNAKSKDILNQIKCRQWWRPVAPIVMEQFVSEWFNNAYPTPYMLQTFSVKTNKLPLIPSVLHLDNTARVQTIKSEDNEKLYSLITQFYMKTGVPILCNTSLNDIGEPIINTPEEAIVFALRKRIPIVYINTWRIELKNFELYIDEKPLRSNFNFRKSPTELQLLQDYYNPFNLSENILQFYYDFPEINKTYSLKNKADVDNILLMYERYLEKWEKR